MLQSNIETAWYNYLVSVVPPEWTVTFAQQKDDAPRPPKPYITIKLMVGPGKMTMRDEKRIVDDGGTKKIALVGQRSYSLSVQAYGSDFNDVLNDVITCLDDSDKRQVLRDSDIGGINPGQVIDVSSRLPTGFESRASLDILFNSSNNKITNLESIETVEIAGEMESESGNIITTNQTIIKE